MKTSYLPLAALTLLHFASSCAEPIGVSNVPQKGGRTSTASATGGTSTTSSGNGGTSTTTTGTGTSTSKGGTTGSTTSTSSGGTTTTTTTASTAGGATTATTAAPIDCGTTSGELVMANAPRTGNDIAATTDISAPAGATVSVADIIVKFCFGVTGIATVAPSATAITLDYAAVNVSVTPYNVPIASTLKITSETSADGGACLVFNVGTTSGVESLKLVGGSSDKITLNWRFSYGGLDRTKPAQVVALLAGATAACSAMSLAL